jgi:lactate dehydrogenase-like 2-hydroxyacid dehydrogenase
VADYGIEDVSDHAMALLLAVGRRVVTRECDLRQDAYSEESVDELQTKAASEMARILRGEEPINWVYRRQFEATTA